MRYTERVPNVVRIRRAVYDRLLEEARRDPFQECCGMLAGRDAVISEIFPTENALHSAREYGIAPRDLFRIFHAMRAAKLEHLGIYHSHPATPNEPSARDIENAFYPDTPYFILSPLPGCADPVRAFLISQGTVIELAIEIV